MEVQPISGHLAPCSRLLAGRGRGGAGRPRGLLQGADCAAPGHAAAVPAGAELGLGARKPRRRANRSGGWSAGREARRVEIFGLKKGSRE